MLTWFYGGKTRRPTRIFKNYSCSRGEPRIVSDKCACAQNIVGWTLSRDLHSIFGRRGGCAFFLLKYIMAESQLKSTKRASGCGHPLYDWDSHLFCYPCRDKGKGQDVCVTSKEEDCFNCLQFTSEQKKKLRSKSKKKTKDIVVSKEVEDSLLGQESDLHRSPTAEKSQPVAEESLLKILQRLEGMQFQITSLKANSSASSSLPAPHQPRASRALDLGEDALSDFSSVHESTSVSSRKRQRSPSPHEEVEEDPTYRETLAAIRTLLEVEVPEESSDLPSKIFGSKNKDSRKKQVLPMVMPPLEGIVQRWDFYEAKASGNPKKGEPERLQCSPVNTDNSLQYNRPPMKFYRSSTVEFSNSAPKCQDAFRSLFPKAIPSSVHIPIRQHTCMETVMRECVQILSYVNWFMKAIGKTSTSMENLLQQGGSEVFRDSLLSHLQMQSACLNSLDKALESVTDLSIALARNLQLARRNSILKVCASHLQGHDFNKLRRTGFKSDLFCPTTLDQIQKKQDKSPKRLKGDSRQSFQSNNRSDDRRSSSAYASGSKFFHGQQEKFNKKPYQSSSSRRGGNRCK